VWLAGRELSAVVAGLIAVTLCPREWRGTVHTGDDQLTHAAMSGAYFVLASNSFGKLCFIAVSSVVLLVPIRSHVGEGSSLSTTAL